MPCHHLTKLYLLGNLILSMEVYCIKQHVRKQIGKRSVMRHAKCTCSDGNVVSHLKYQLLAYSLTICQPKIVSEYDQEIPQSQNADNPVAPRGRAA